MTKRDTEGEDEALVLAGKLRVSLAALEAMVTRLAHEDEALQNLEVKEAAGRLGDDGGGALVLSVLDTIRERLLALSRTAINCSMAIGHVSTKKKSNTTVSLAAASRRREEQRRGYVALLDDKVSLPSSTSTNASWTSRRNNKERGDPLFAERRTPPDQHQHRGKKSVSPQKGHFWERLKVARDKCPLHWAVRSIIRSASKRPASAATTTTRKRTASKMVLPKDMRNCSGRQQQHGSEVPAPTDRPSLMPKRAPLLPPEPHHLKPPSRFKKKGDPPTTSSARRASCCTTRRSPTPSRLSSRTSNSSCPATGSTTKPPSTTVAPPSTALGHPTAATHRATSQTPPPNQSTAATPSHATASGSCNTTATSSSPSRRQTNHSAFKPCL